MIKGEVKLRGQGKDISDVVKDVKDNLDKLEIHARRTNIGIESSNFNKALLESQMYNLRNEMEHLDAALYENQVAIRNNSRSIRALCDVILELDKVLRKHARPWHQKLREWDSI